MRSALLAAAIAIAGGTASTGGAAAQTPGPAAGKPGEVDRWVAQLGADDYHARARAQEALILLGEAARPAATVALKHDSLEVRSRAARVIATLDLLAAEERRQQLERDLNRFVAGELSGDEAKLPTWPRFRKTIGEDQPSRELFAAMVRAELDLMQLAAERSEEFSHGLRQRLVVLELEKQVRQQHRTPSNAVPCAAAMLWLSTEPAGKVPSAQVQPMCLFAQAEISLVIRELDATHPLKRLAIAWMQHDHGDEDDMEMCKLFFAQSLHLPEGAVVAERILRRDKASVTTPMKVSSLTVLFMVGAEKHVPLLEAQLEDATVLRSVTSNGICKEYQVRDMALEGLVRITKQNDTDYFGAQYKVPPFGPSVFRGFPDQPPRLRENAIEKWKRWSADHRRTPPEPPDAPRR